MNKDSYRVGVVQEGPVAFDGENYWNQRAMGSYLQRLSRQCGPIDIYAHIIGPEDPSYEAFHEMEIEASWASVHALPKVGHGGLLVAFLRHLRLFPFFRRELRRNDIVFFFLPATFAFWGIIARRFQGRPYALYFGSDWDEVSTYGFRWHGLARLLMYRAYVKTGQLLQRFAIRGALFAITAGEALQEKIKQSGVPTYSAIPRMNLTSDDCFFREDTCQKDTVTCLFVGSLIPRKGLDCLVDAFSELRHRGLPVSLLIVGAGELEGWLKTQLQEKGLTHAAQMLGHVPSGSTLWNMYRASDIFVLPTRSEGFPRVLYEAMSQSLPIVTTNVSGIPHLMKDKENALLVQPGNPTALADAIDEIVRKPDLRRKIILSGQRTVRPLLDADPGLQLRELLAAHYR